MGYILFKRLPEESFDVKSKGIGGIFAITVLLGAAAIYYSLGDPSFIVPIIHETLNTGQNIKDPILNFLVEIEKTLQHVAQNPTTDNESTLEQVNDIIQFTTEIVELFGNESSEAMRD